MPSGGDGRTGYEHRKHVCLKKLLKHSTSHRNSRCKQSMTHMDEKNQASALLANALHYVTFNKWGANHTDISHLRKDTWAVIINIMLLFNLPSTHANFTVNVAKGS